MKKFYVPSFDEKGHAKLNPRYEEILKLYDMLTDSRIPFTLRRNFDGWQILYPAVLAFPEEKDNVLCSVIEHYGSYGQEQDLLEIMGLLTPEEKEDDSVLGYQTASQVFERIKQHWEQNGGKHEDI